MTTDKPTETSPATPQDRAREALLATVFGSPQIAGKAKELLQAAILPSVFMVYDVPKYTDEQKAALKYYQGTKFTRNKPAMDLVKENILLDGTLDDDGRIKSIKLTDDSYTMTVGPSAGRKIVGAKSALNAFLFFHRGYNGGTGTDAPYDREGFRLSMKKAGFDVPEGGITKLEDVTKAAKAGLTDEEQFKLDCLVIRSLCDPIHRIGAEKKRTLVLSDMERTALDDAVERFNKRLALDKPEDFPKNFAKAYSFLLSSDRFDGDAKTDRKVFSEGAKRALIYEGDKAKLADAVDKWLASTDADGADLQKKWTEAMKAMPDVKSQIAFRELIIAFFDEKHPKAGAQLGLNKALRDARVKDDPEKVAAAIKAEALEEKARRDKKK